MLFYNFDQNKSYEKGFITTAVLLTSLVFLRQRRKIRFFQK